MIFREKNDKAVLESIMGVMKKNATAAQEDQKKIAEHRAHLYKDMAPKKTVAEGVEACPVCGQTPCNCTHVVDEQQLGEGEQLNAAKKLANREYRMADSMAALAKKYNKTGVDTGRDTAKSFSKKAARDLTRLKSEEVELEEAAVGDNHLHVSHVGGGKYQVHAVGKNFSDGIKVGEHLSDTELDDFSEMGGKIKHVNAPKAAKPVKEALTLAAILDEARGRPRKDGSPAGSKPAKAKSEDDDEYGPDTGPEADQNIVVHLKKSTDTEGQHDVKFSDGSTHKVPAHVAHSVLGAMEKLKPADRAKVQSHIQQSHKNLMDVHKMVS